jgi:hypothetical protein
MKALQMLDHVVLWYARSFAAMFLSYFFYVYLSDGLVLYSTLRQLHWRWNESFNLIIPLTIALMALALLNISLWFQRRILSRFYILAIGAWFFLEDGITLTWNGGFGRTIAALFILSFASNIWVAIRPSKSSKFFGPNSINDPPLPQSC